MNELQIAQTRLANAQATAIELRTGRSKRDMLSTVECGQLLNRLASRLKQMDLGSRAASARVSQLIDDELLKIHETLLRMQEAGR